MKGDGEVLLGWEKVLGREAADNKLIGRLGLEKGELRAIIVSASVFLVVFFIGGHLAVQGTDTPWYAFLPGSGFWTMNWWVVFLAVIFEFLDASAGMGYGTAITPLLLLLGYHPVEIIPAIMIQQGTAGLTGAYLHNAFGNVEWRVKPLSETMRLWIFISVTGILAAILSITSVYAVLKLGDQWIKAYVAGLLVIMGFASLFNGRRLRPYRPRRMLFFGALAGFNKGIGGGGYGPVVTIGGIFSGVPLKTMMAVTALSEGTVCMFSLVVWYFVERSGVSINFGLLPSMMLGSMISAIAAPWAVKVIHARFWKWFVPAYSCILAVFSVVKLL